jgi:hypothetical protein
LVVKILLWSISKLRRGEDLLKSKIEKKLVKENYPIEFSGMLIIILKLRSTKRQKHIEEAQKQYRISEIYKNFNPKYSENVIPLKEAKLKVVSSDIIYSTKKQLKKCNLLTKTITFREKIYPIWSQISH